MNLIEMLETLPDFRRKQGQRYPLAVIILITIMSIMSGRYRYREIAAFAEANKKDLLKFFKLKRKRLASLSPSVKFSKELILIMYCQSSTNGHLNMLL